MKTITKINYEEMSITAANFIFQLMKDNNKLTIILPTGSSPKRMYEYLIQLIKKENFDYSNITWIKLDEWVGLSTTHPSTCEYFLETFLFKPLDIDRNKIISYDADTKNPQQEIERVRKLLPTVIDIAILGVGKNGHLGLNEPSLELVFEDHVTTLASSSKEHTMLANENVCLDQGMTLGMKTLLASKNIILLVTGQGKEEAMSKFNSQVITTLCPVTLLHLHSNCHVFIDQTYAHSFTT